MSETETERQKAAATHAGDADVPRASDAERPSNEPDEEQAELGGPAEAGAVAEADDEPGNRRARRAAAARARKQRVKEREEAQAIGLDTQERLDDAFVRSTDTAAKWLKRNVNILQWVFVGGISAWAAWGLYGWQKARSEATSSDKVAKAFAAQFGKVGEDETKADSQIIDPTPVFSDDEARLEAARQAYEAALKNASNDGTGLYARLALASVLLDQGKPDEAKAELERVLAAKFTNKDTALEVQAREGLAQVAERKGDKAGALALYEQIAATGLQGPAEHAQYNQARLLNDLGRTDEAKKIVSQLYEKYPPQEGIAGMFPGYVEQGVKTLANVLGVEAPKPKPAPITQAQVNDLAAELQRQIKDKSAPAPAGETKQ